MDERPASQDRLLGSLRAAAAEVTPVGPTVMVPLAGELWRGRWEGSACVLLLLEVHRSTAHAAPVTLDPDDADEESVVTPAEQFTLGLPTTIWLGLATEIPVRVLDRRFAALTSPQVDWTLMERLVSLPRGRRVHTASDSRALVRARMNDAVEAFADATWVPEHQGGLPALLVDVDFDQLVDVLGSPQAALGVQRGRQPLSETQAQALGELLQRDAGELLASNPALPDELVEVFDQPQVRAQVVRLSQRRGVSELRARRAAAYEVYAMAARQPGGRAPDWAGRARQYFAAHLEDDA